MTGTLRLIALAALLCLAAPAAGAAAEHAPIVGGATTNDGHAARVGAAAPVVPVVVPRMAGPAHYTGGPPPTVAVAAPPARGGPLLAVRPSAPPLAADFLGIPYTRFFPPDPSVAAGPDKLVLVVNGAIALFSKTGSNLLQRSLESFFNGPLFPGGFAFDPKLVFDPHSGRFVLVTIEGQASPNSWLRIAVSKSDHPSNLSVGPTAASDWFGFNIDADKDGGAQVNGNWADFPSLGVDQYNLYVTANMFSNAGDFQYPKVWIIPKAGLLAGEPPTVFEFGAPPAPALTNPATGFADFTIAPALDFDAGAEHLLAANALSPDGATGYVTFWTVNNPTGSPTLSSVNLAVAGWKEFTVPACPQAGGGTPLDAGDTRILRVVERNGSLWATHTQPNAHTGATRAEARWYQINPVGPAVVQFGEVTDPTRCYFYPAIQPDAQGNVGLVISGVDATIFGSAFYTGRFAADPPGTMQAVAAVQEGKASYVAIDPGGANRWGDFGGISWDPTTGDIWMLHEYASAAVNQWSTWVGKVQWAPPPVNTPTGTATATPTVSPTTVPTATETPTPSPTITATATATWTVTPRNTATVTPSATPTITRSDTPTATRTHTRTVSPTLSPTATVTDTRTASPTPTPTASASATGTVTATVSPTATLSPTTTPTPTPSFTLPPSPTPTPTATATPPPLRGDVNCDGRVSAADLPALVILLPGGGVGPCGAADTNRDGHVTGADIDAAIELIFGSALP